MYVYMAFHVGEFSRKGAKRQIHSSWKLKGGQFQTGALTVGFPEVLFTTTKRKATYKIVLFRHTFILYVNYVR